MNNQASVMKREENSKRSQTEVTCPCGTTYKLCNQKTHKQSHKHKYYLLQHSKPEPEPQPLLQPLPQKEAEPGTERIVMPGLRTVFVRKKPSNHL